MAEEYRQRMEKAQTLVTQGFGALSEQHWDDEPCCSLKDIYLGAVGKKPVAFL
jgi:hypothetical protein